MFRILRLQSQALRWFYPKHTIKRVITNTIAMICIVSSFSSTQSAFADELLNTNSSELQAAFIYNFMLFSQWPEPKEERLLCTAGQNRDSLKLKNLDGKELNNAKLRVKSVVTDNEIADCDALFIASLEYIHLSDSVKDSPVLVFSNLMPDYADNIAILITNTSNRVVFDVRINSLRRSGVHLSSSVLRLARSTL